MRPGGGTVGRVPLLSADSDPAKSFHAREERFAMALLAPAFVVLMATTTFPLLYLIWTSAYRIDLAMPFTNGYIGFENYRNVIGDHRFWSSLVVSLIYTATTVLF